MTLAGDQIFDRGDAAAILRQADLDVAEVEPELRGPCRVSATATATALSPVDGLLDEADHVAVIDLRKSQIAGLLQRRVLLGGAG